MLVPQIDPVEFLILGAGWTSTFLIPLLEKYNIKFAATSTTGRDGTIPFRYDPESDDKAAFQRLPSATTILITFPLKGKGQSKHLTSQYKATHPSGASPTGPNFIQLGATSIWKEPTWSSETSPYDKSNDRAIAEDELMEVARGCVLDLAGLYGGQRQPSNWVDRVIKDKASLKAKGAVHLIHGNDVARAILAVHEKFTPAKRWLLTDLRIYDWWDLVQDWSTKVLRQAKQGGDISKEDLKKHEDLARWVTEAMREEDVRALPREASVLGRVLDGRKFWETMGVIPIEGRVR